MCYQKLFAIFILTITVNTLGFADNSQNLEYKLKALYIVRLADFIIWPENPDKQTFKICVDSNDLIADQLHHSTITEIKGRKLEIIDPPADSLDQCDVLYLSKGKIDPSLSRIPVVTISSQADFAKHGGMIEFYIEKAKVRMKANLQSAHKAGIRLRSKLIRLLTIVQQVEEHED